MALTQSKKRGRLIIQTPPSSTAGVRGPSGRSETACEELHTPAEKGQNDALGACTIVGYAWTTCSGLGAPRSLRPSLIQIAWRGARRNCSVK